MYPSVAFEIECIVEPFPAECTQISFGVTVTF